MPPIESRGLGRMVSERGGGFLPPQLSARHMLTRFSRWHALLKGYYQLLQSRRRLLCSHHVTNRIDQGLDFEALNQTANGHPGLVVFKPDRLLRMLHQDMIAQQAQDHATL